MVRLVRLSPVGQVGQVEPGEARLNTVGQVGPVEPG